MWGEGSGTHSYVLRDFSHNDVQKFPIIMENYSLTEIETEVPESIACPPAFSPIFLSIIVFVYGFRYIDISMYFSYGHRGRGEEIMRRRKKDKLK